MTTAKAQRLLDVIEHEILPLTRAGVAAGNKVFGAAILHKETLETVVAETNNEMENPLWHGEMHALKRFYERTERPDTKDLVFLSTHEPCSLCLSAITWAGFDNFTYFFSHEDSRDSFAIPHDLKILSEVFGDTNYRRENAFWRATALTDLMSPDQEPQAARIRAAYDALSETYQDSKDDNAIPLN